MIDEPRRVCVKLFAPEPGVPDSTFVPIFHEWIRDRALGLVLLDVADYTHVPDSPGVMLIAHEAAFSLDRTDGRLGLLAQQRRPIDGGMSTAIAITLRQALAVADRLEADRRLAGRLMFDRARIRVEANDRLRAPNNELGFRELAPRAQAGLETVFPASSIRIVGVETPRRDRLAVDGLVTRSNSAGREPMESAAG